MPFNLAIIDKLLHEGSVAKSKHRKRRQSKNTQVKNKTEVSTVKKTYKQKPSKDMNASVFRFINEKLSNMTSTEAYEFFRNDPEAFKTYHAGFSNQRDKWPEDPAQWIISRINSLENRKNLIIADLGCGEGNLSKILASTVKQFHNFDLVSTNDSIISCDIANLPLEDKSVDVVVISLALMGVNSNEYIAESNRVLKEGGSLIIIELISRMKSPNFFIGKIKKMGFEKQTTNVDKKDQKNAYFMKLHLKKVRDCDKTNLPDLELKAVLYKKR